MRKQKVFGSLLGGGVFIASYFILLVPQAVTYPPFLKKAQALGLPAQDCTYCHLRPQGGEGWNERGQWLRAEKKKRNEERVDVAWLKEYPADSTGGNSSAASSSGASAGSTSQQTTAAAGGGAASDWTTVGQTIGRAGAMQPGDVYKIGLPRTDLQVTAGGVAIKPALALGSWLAFKKMGDHAMVMGDLVLTEDEVTPVMTKLQAGGIEQSALHNHVLHESPRVMYMHVSGHGDAKQLAQTLHDALVLTKTPLANPASGGSSTTPAAAPDMRFDPKQLDQVIGFGGKVNGGVYQFSVPRAEKIMQDGMEVPPSMGTATAVNFQPTGGGKAAITGDFVMIGSEVNNVIRALRENGIEVTALHSHMIGEEPRLYFMHFWANDDAQKLAKGIRAALDQTNSQKSQTK